MCRPCSLTSPQARDPQGIDRFLVQPGIVATETGGLVTRSYIEVPEPTLRRATAPVLCVRRGVVAHADGAVARMAGCSLATPKATSIVVVADSEPGAGGECYAHRASP